MKTISIPETLALAIAEILAELPAGKTAKMLIALEDAFVKANKETYDGFEAGSGQD